VLLGYIGKGKNKSTLLAIYTEFLDILIAYSEREAQGTQMHLDSFPAATQ